MFDYLEGGHPLDEFLEGFPSVTREQVLEVLEFARKTITSEKMLRFAEQENV